MKNIILNGVWILFLFSMAFAKAEISTEDFPVNPQPQCLQNQIGSCPGESPEFLGAITGMPPVFVLGELSTYENRLLDGFRRAALDQNKPIDYYVIRYFEAKAKEQANLKTEQVAKLAESVLCPDTFAIMLRDGTFVCAKPFLTIESLKGHYSSAYQNLVDFEKQNLFFHSEMVKLWNEKQAFEAKLLKCKNSRGRSCK